jgi:hypothetical protein
MPVRRFGPVAGAGVVVEEIPTERTITPAPTGVTCYIGRTEKGDVDEIIHCPTKADFARKCGGYVDYSELPDSAFDFYNLGQGAGELFVVRVTDGAEVQAEEEFYSRHSGHAYENGDLPDPTYNEIKTQLLRIKAKNGGIWGGRRKVRGGADTFPGAVTATTLTTGDTMLVNEWAGARLYLKDASSKVYTVVSNTIAGVVTVTSDSDMLTDIGSGTDGHWVMALDQKEITFPTQQAGIRKAVSVLFKDGEEHEDNYFGLEIYNDGSIVKDYPNLSLDPVSKWYLPNVVDLDPSNFWIETEVLYAGAVSVDHRPVSWFGRAQNWSGTTLTIQVAHVANVTSAVADPGWVENWVIGLSVQRVVRHKIRLTFTSATAFSIATVTGDGAVFAGLGSGVVNTAVAPQHPWTVGFTVRRGEGNWTTGDIVDIDVLPLPTDDDANGLLTGWLYYNLGSDKRARLRIVGNTSDTIEVSSAPAVTPDNHERATATITTGNLTYPITLASGALTIHHSGFRRAVLSIATGPHANAAALATAINTAWATAVTPDVAGNIATASGNAILFGIDSGATDENVGRESFLKIMSANSGVNSLNLDGDEFIVGALGDEFRVEAPVELRGGYDGDEPVDADYTRHADTIDSVINRIRPMNKGLVKLAVPGVTTTAIQQAFLEYVSARNYQFRVEIPDTVDDDAAAVAHINDAIGRNDMGVFTYPSYGYVPNPQGEGLVLRSLTGSIHGREALVARGVAGYHKAAAGIDVTLPNVKKLPTGERVLNEEILNPQGVNVVKRHRSGSFILWGDRTISLDPGWKWKHQREQMSHYENTLLVEFDYVIFAINDRQTQDELVSVLRAFFLPEWTKRALRGTTFDKACSIKIDDENNTDATRANGDLNAEIKLRLADTVERFIIRIGKAGIFEDLAS